MLDIISPAELHARAKENPVVEAPIESLPFYTTVGNFINNSKGHSRAPIPLCGKLTTEYAIVPMPSNIVDSEGMRIKDWLQERGFFVTVRADSLARFQEEALMIICWDPEVLAVSKETEWKEGIIDARQLYCVLPGKEHQLCNHCYRCHESFSGHAEFVPPSEGLR